MKYRGINKETEIKLDKFYELYTSSKGDIKTIIKLSDNITTPTNDPTKNTQVCDPKE